ncbi:hypothetical protein ACN94T_002566 [Acinetobacter baumannii]|nr:hypothetical protein [Acinetobacter baumannii]EKX9959416.1 hypothetical protein [Acinetobacter baumannii]EKY0928433.1 hypothetical protein [Acinetobacter baumannii]EKY1173478.1 hypothetical protein [Acinetobacter baumannii]HCW3947856.1 hypothetical protein [Acinetobacter baumannii]
MTQPTQLPNEIQSAQHMGQIILDWLHNRQAYLTHLREIPDTEKLEVTDEDSGEVINLEGPQRSAFFMGIAVAQHAFLELPFQAVDVPDDSDEQTA